MPSLLLPNEILSLSSQAAGRLLDAGDGDCALLYLALLRGGGDREKARTALNWDGGRYAAAARRLAGMGLTEAEELSPEAEQRLNRPAEYTQADLNTALESERSFRGLSDAVEGQLGRPLTTNDLKTLLRIYDELALPCEVILTLTQWCVSETERTQGKGHRPRMSDVKKEALFWKKQGLTTPERAEEFLRRQEGVSRRERDILTLLGIRDRAAVGDERRYLTDWVEMGFADDAIRLAYEKTVFRKQHMNWPYMNSILKKWHQAGLHTVAQVEAGDRPPQREDRTRTGQSGRAQPDYQPTADRIQKNADWLDDFLKKQEEG